MTISTETRKVQFTGNGVATDFSFSFKVFAQADLYVVHTLESTGAETVLVLDTDYTVTLNGDQNVSPGGTVTLPAPLASGYLLTITTQLAYTQGVDLTNTGGFFPRVISDALDRITMLVQQGVEGISRSLKYSVSTPAGVSSELPYPAAYKVLAWKGDLSGLENVDPSGSGSLGSDLSASSGSSLVGFLQAGTGAVARTAQAKMRDVVSIKDFNAAADGVTDDSAELQAAIDSLSYGAVYLPAGKYYINAAVNLKNKVSLIGDGKAATEVYFGASGSFALTGSVGSRIGYLTIEGIGLTNQGAGSPAALTMTEATRVLLTDCTIYNIGVTLDAFNYITFDRCDMFGGTLTAHHSTINEVCEALKIYGCNTSGYAVTVKDTADVVVESSHFMGAAAKVSISRGEQNAAFYPPVFISDTVVDSGDDEGIYLSGVSPKLANVFVSSGRTNLKDGIYMTDCVEGGLVNVQSRYCGHDGLWMGSCVSVTVEGCVFNDNKRYGVRIGDCDNIRFIGNTADNAPSWYGGSYVQTNGISDEPSNCTNIVCVGNELGTATPLYLPGATNIVIGNVGTTEHSIPGTLLRPQADNTMALGSTSYRFSDIHCMLMRNATYTVATLPAAATAGEGARCFVGDANATTFASIVAGGGANKVPVYCDGTNWRIG